MKQKTILVLLATFALLFGSCKTDSDADKSPSAQEKINAAVDAVTLDAPAKASMTARELTGDKIMASGFDANAYRIEYLNIAGNEANRTASVTFRLSKGTLQSKSRTISINGFKEKAQAPSAQEKINAAVDAVTLDAPAKASMTARELTGDKIMASGFDANAYRIEYLNIAGNEANRTASVTFRLSKGTLQSKSRTISINGFKEKPQAPSAQERINAAVDAVTLDAPAKASMTASELTGDKITASGFDSNVYRIEYLNIAGDEENRTAAVTFRLSKGTLQSKSRTISINGFKEKPQAPPAPEYVLPAAELLSVCDVQQGRESAAAAAKKIAAAAGKTLSGITFTSAVAVRYDDERGTFTVKVKGAKDGKNFDTEITQTGFTHPYASPLQSVQECVFDLNPAIEENLSLDAYISKAETDVSAYLKFSMQLENGKRVTLGKRDGYRFAAQIGKDGNELKAVPQYFLSYKRLQTGGAETEEEKAYMHGAARAQKKPYFTENDVFSYVLGKTNANFITVDSTIFASSVYAIGKAAGAADVFDMEQIQKYIDRYQTKTDGTHLGLKLTVGLYNAKNDTIRADDSAGELTLQYCITTEDALAEHITGGAIRGTAISESITKSGFKRADAAALKRLFVFKILKNGGSNDEAAKKWKRYMTGNGFNHDYRLVTSTDDTYTVNSFPAVNSQPFYFTINDEQEPANVFAKAGRSGLSEGNSREEILITRLILEKKPGEQKLSARFTLVEGTTISVDYSPAF